jgi:hypothetical protein
MADVRHELTVLSDRAVGKRQQLQIIVSYLFACVDHVMVTLNITKESSAQSPTLQLPVAGPPCTLRINSKGKFKVHPRKGHESPEGGGVYV